MATINGDKARPRGRPASVALLLLFLVLAAVQLGTGGFSRVPWLQLSTLLGQPSPVSQAGRQGGVPPPAPLLPGSVVKRRRVSRPPAVPAAIAAEKLPRGDNSSYLALCISVKDEHCDIREWVLHHASLGVGKVYLFDTQSDPPMRDVLDDMIVSGLVEYTFLTNDTTEVELEPPTTGRSVNWQRPIYRLCLDRYGSRHKWMGFFDADEFVMLDGATPAAPGSLPALLERYEDYGGLALHWKLFAFSGHVLRAREGLLASYTACTPRISPYLKSIVQTRYRKGVQTVHSFTYTDKKYAINTAGVRVWKAVVKKGEQTEAEAVLYHYISRSLADFEIKMRRRGGAGSVKTLANFLGYYRGSNAVCTAAVPLGQALARRYDLNRNVPRRCLDMERRRRRLGKL